MIGGSTGTSSITGTTDKRAFMALFNYVGGLRWGYYE